MTARGRVRVPDVARDADAVLPAGARASGSDLCVLSLDAVGDHLQDAGELVEHDLGELPRAAHLAPRARNRREVLGGIGAGTEGEGAVGDASFDGWAVPSERGGRVGERAGNGAETRAAGRTRTAGIALEASMKLIARGGVLCRESKGGQAGVPRRGGIPPAQRSQHVTQFADGLF